MARVVLVGNLVQLTGGAANFDLAATSVKHLFELLAERHPALAPHLAEGVAVAIDGQIYQDTLHEPIAPDSEVFVLPQIAGGTRIESLRLAPPPALRKPLADIVFRIPMR